MKLLVLLPVIVVLVILAIGAMSFFKGQTTAVNLYHICGKKVGWYEAMFLDPIRDKSGCEKYGPVPCSNNP
ncbi:MAG: hypothetical protein VBE63_06230 [Lamprobacter sp.]|uniref:hypothetical protein n=1 Tax=Lamprobacter sp. TaxID=3100796 RepID=UPI002B2614D4|nr:hypothetical protein [Lamprobacter sp.]MEA3639524.1 hypothetical protein [Lamprobacter sp.]